MEQTELTIVNELRRMALREYTPAQMLREMIRFLGPGAHKLTLIAQMREAFGLSLAEASPIAGWSPEATAEVSDARLDELIGPAIRKNGNRWEQEKSD